MSSAALSGAAPGRAATCHQDALRLAEESAETQHLRGFLLVGPGLPSIASFVFVLLTVAGLEHRRLAEQRVFLVSWYG